MELLYKKFKDVNINDSFFDSLKEAYTEFSDWFHRKSEEKAYVFETDDNSIIGFLYLKIEDGAITDIQPPLPAKRRLKVGTMKINAHGTKMGERFIKKIIDHAIFCQTSEIYVTVFAVHEGLIRLLATYGFIQAGSKTTHNGTELVFVKNILSSFRDIFSSYPIVSIKGKKVYLLSLYPEWHSRLLPDSILKGEDTDIIQDISSANSIHKVYLTSMAGVENLRTGDALVIYRTSDGLGPAHYRSVATSIGVVEDYKNIHTFSSWEDFYSYCRPYSVFERSELESFWKSKKYQHVFKFTYNFAFKKRVTRGRMIEEIGMAGDKYWGFLELTQKQFHEIALRGEVDESLIID